MEEKLLRVIKLKKKKNCLRLRKSQSNKSLEAEITLWENISMCLICSHSLPSQPLPLEARHQDKGTLGLPSLAFPRLSLKTEEK